MPLSLIALPIILAVLKVAAVAAIGFILARRSILHDSATSDISDLVIKLAVPCLVFSNAAGGFVGMSTSVATALVLAGPAVIGLGYLCAVILVKLGRVDIAYRKAVVAASAFQNSAYLPIAVSTAVAPLVVRVTGHPETAASTAAGAAVVCISLFGVLYSPIFWGIGLSWITNDSPEKKPFRELIPRLFPPPVIGLIAGYLVAFTPLHIWLVPKSAPLHFLFDAMADIGGMTVPMSNSILGAMLAKVGSGVKEPVGNYLIVIVTRFVLVPAAFLALILACRTAWSTSPFAVIAAFVIFLQSITPPATNLAVMSKGVSPDSPYHTAAAIPRLLLVAYLMCMLTVPAWLLVFLHLIQKR